MEEIIRLENVKYSYKSGGNEVRAVKNATATFYRGRLYSIVGRSGSGKSTLLSLMAGLDLPQGGEIFFCGKSLKEIDRDHYRSHEVGIIYQSYNLIPYYTAYENVELALDVLGSRIKNKDELIYGVLEKVGIDREKAKRKASRLSGGEQQRVAIARALSIDPKLILADEPTGNLDSETSDEICKIFLKLAHEDGKCVVIVTHSKEVAKLSDKIYKMKDGVLQEAKLISQRELAEEDLTLS